MKYQLNVCKISNYLKIEFSGSWTRKNGIRITNEIEKNCNSTDCRYILFDIRKATNTEVSTMGDFFEAEYAASLFCGTHHKIALLLKKCDYEEASWFETVGRNRGLQIYRFTDEEDAIRWLR